MENQILELEKNIGRLWKIKILQLLKDLPFSPV